MRSFVLVLIFAAAACGKAAPASTAPRNSPPVAAPVADVPLDKAALERFVAERFAGAVAAGTVTLDFGSDGVEAQVLGELAALGIDTVAELAAIVPPDFDRKGIGALASAPDRTTTTAGLLRDLMIIHDVRGYFTKAWNDAWVASGPQDFPVPAAYGVDFGVMVELGVFGDGDPCGGDPCGGDPCGGDPCGGDPCGGDPCGDPCSGDPCGGW